MFKTYDEKTGKKLQVTYVPVSEYDARLAANPKDFAAFLHRYWAIAEPFKQNDSHVYPDWNPSPVIDSLTNSVAYFMMRPYSMTCSVVSLGSTHACVAF